MPEKTKVYISFGQRHSHVVPKKRGGLVTLDRNCIAVLECENYAAGRGEAFKLFKGIFHNCWSQEEWDKGDYLKYFPRGLIEI